MSDIARISVSRLNNETGFLLHEIADMDEAFRSLSPHMLASLFWVGRTRDKNEIEQLLEDRFQTTFKIVYEGRKPMYGETKDTMMEGITMQVMKDWFKGVFRSLMENEEEWLDWGFDEVLEEVERLCNVEYGKRVEIGEPFVLRLVEKIGVEIESEARERENAPVEAANASEEERGPEQGADDG